MNWWGNIHELANNLGPLANVLGIMGVSVISTGISVYGFMRRRHKRQEIINENLKENSRLQDEEIEDLKREIDTLRQYDPHMWLELAGRERRDGNEEKAITALRSGVMLTNDALHESYLTLTRYHVAIYPDQGGSLHLQEAERLSQIAALLKPDDKVATTLLEEIRETMAMENIHRGRYNPDDLYEPSTITGLYGSDLGEKFVDMLITLGRKHYQAGRYIFFERLTQRARAIALRELEKNSKTTCGARNQWAFALCLNGYIADAKTEVEELLLLMGSISSAQHPDTLAIRNLHAQILDLLGQHQEALNEVEELLLFMETIPGAQHPDTLATRYLHAQILNFLGRHPEALNEVEKLLPLMESVLGAQHPNTLSARYLYAQILASLERHPQALNEVEKLLPIEENVRGAQHPSTLLTRNLHAQILNSLGRHPEALNEVEELLPLMESVLGVQHPNTLSARYLYALFLASRGWYPKALDKVEELLPLMEKVRGTTHPDTLKATSLKEEILKILKG